MSIYENLLHQVEGLFDSPTTIQFDDLKPARHLDLENTNVETLRGLLRLGITLCDQNGYAALAYTQIVPYLNETDYRGLVHGNDVILFAPGTESAFMVVNPQVEENRSSPPMIAVEGCGSIENAKVHMLMSYSSEAHITGQFRSYSIPSQQMG